MAATDRAYAATRAWGWRHGFKDIALTALAAAKEVARQRSNSPPGQSGAQPERDAGGVGPSGSNASKRSIEAAGSEALPVDVSLDVVRECQDVAAASTYYDALVPDEVATLVALGLRAAKGTHSGYT